MKPRFARSSAFFQCSYKMRFRGEEVKVFRDQTGDRQLDRVEIASQASQNLRASNRGPNCACCVLIGPLREKIRADDLEAPRFLADIPGTSKTLYFK